MQKGLVSKTSLTRKDMQEQKKDIQLKSKYYYFVIAAVFLLLAAANIFLYRREYRNYETELEIMTAMMEHKGDYDYALKMFRGETDVAASKAEEFLSEYGYYDAKRQVSRNVYYRHFRDQVWINMVVSSTLFLLIYGVFWLLKRDYKAKQREMNKELAAIISSYRNGDYSSKALANRTLSDARDVGIYVELEALGDTLSLLQQQVTKEREEIKALVTDVSHQLKTPVAALQACFDILSQENLQENERQEFSLRCCEQLNGLKNLVSALINISRMESGMIQIKKEEARLFDTLLNAINRVYLKAQEKEIDIELVAEETSKDRSIVHDKKWVCEAFINILENGIKYSPEHTRIEIRFQERPVYMRIEIEDQGIGISKREYNQIFQRFYRGQSDEVKAQQGSGIGLYLVRKIINQHAGMITVSSHGSAGEGSHRSGSVFVIQLPYRQ